MVEESNEPIVIPVSAQVNLDACTAIAFVSENSPVRGQLTAYVQGKQMVMVATAMQEFQDILGWHAGSTEQARAVRFLSRILAIPDKPSARALRLRTTRALDPNDIRIFGTGDQLGIITMTSDRQAVSASRAQGISFAV